MGYTRRYNIRNLEFTTAKRKLETILKKVSACCVILCKRCSIGVVYSAIKHTQTPPVSLSHTHLSYTSTLSRDHAQQLGEYTTTAEDDLALLESRCVAHEGDRLRARAPTQSLVRVMCSESSVLSAHVRTAIEWRMVNKLMLRRVRAHILYDCTRVWLSGSRYRCMSDRCIPPRRRIYCYR